MSDADSTHAGYSENSPALVSKSAILEAAICCFEKFGYFETTYADIAANAGLKVKDVTSIFPTKDEVLAEYITTYEDDLRMQLEGHEDPDATQLEQIYYICKTSLIFLRTHKVITAIWFEFYRHNVAKVVLRRFFGQIKARLAKLVSEGIEQGTIKKKNEQDVVEAIIALVEGTLIISRLEESTDFEQRFDNSWAIMEEGLRA
ncbi:TetR/AcrR family transcriptional regulator [Pseudovibrio brasiliensis]|uniref:TetR/AcrR family transcriptional regulator n=1 Tax=Pseudovibrio brasiliensis TaxID=1898042 RepID=A0ABX8AUG7_9HYPH|nr:TetR/AcrR family transcriptional regulator [Pseudovibrio brasiliensis]QUS58365.1 TetR/AcrR family transcriptional regulator [Pseudovibrio brasiliensis]